MENKGCPVKDSSKTCMEKACPIDWKKCPVLKEYMDKCPHQKSDKQCPMLDSKCPYFKDLKEKCPFYQKHMKE